VVSHALYPTVFDDFQQHRLKYGNVSLIPTHAFLHSLELGEDVQFVDGRDKESEIKMLGMTAPLPNGVRSVLFEINGEPRVVSVRDEKVSPKAGGAIAERADPIDAGSVGSPLSGVVVALKVSKGDTVEKGTPLAVMSVRLRARGKWPGGLVGGALPASRAPAARECPVASVARS
jgi:pyruvate carboxylase